MTTARQREREAKKLAHEIAVRASIRTGKDSLSEFLKGVPPHLIAIAFERAIADVKLAIEVNEKYTERRRADLALLERLRPATLRKKLRIVE
jgi:hypothetical protein